MKWFLLCVLLFGCNPGDSFQFGDQWCTRQFDGTLYCEPLEGEKEVR